MGTATEVVSERSGPVGGVATASTALVTVPASASAWVRTYVAVAVAVWPGATVPAVPGQVKHRGVSPGSSSRSSAPMSATLPVLQSEN